MVQNFSVEYSRERSERIRNTEKALLEAKEENQKYRSEIESELKSRLELKSQRKSFNSTGTNVGS